MSRVSEAVFVDRLDDSISLARVVHNGNSSLMYFNRFNLIEYYRDRARLVEWLMLSEGRDLNWLPELRTDGDIRIGVLHGSMAPGTESYYLLAHLENSGLPRSSVTLYTFDAGVSSLRIALEAWVKSVVTLPTDVGEAVRLIRGDDLDLLLVATNVTWGFPPETEVAAHRLARLQVVGAASPVTSGLASCDLYLSGQANELKEDAQDLYEERLVRLPGTIARYAFSHDRDPPTLSCSREQLGVSPAQTVFFSAANYYKLVPELMSVWINIVKACPDSVLVLMPFNPNWGKSYPSRIFAQRLLVYCTNSGLDTRRIRVIDKVPTRADLHAIMSNCDVYLDSFPFSGGCSLIDPLTVGLPIVTLFGDTLRNGIAASMLPAAGLAGAICQTPLDYQQRAIRLALDVEYYARERASAAATAATRSFLATQEFARAFAGFCTSAVNAARGYVRSLLLDPYALDAAANDAADAALQRMPPALRLLAGDDLLSLLLIPYLLSQQQVPKSDLRAVDLGAGTGRLWQRLLEAGVEIVVHGVEPSFPPAPGLDPLKLLRRRLSERFDLVGVSSDVPLDTVVTELNGAQAKPLIVIARVDVGEEPAAHKSGEPAVAEMERQGFDCVTFGHRTERGIDEHLVTFRRGYGDLRHAGATQATIVFYRSGDPWLLSLLCFLFESYSPGHLRSTAVAAAGTPASSAITVVR
jgi:hypothetical protein